MTRVSCGGRAHHLEIDQVQRRSDQVVIDATVGEDRKEDKQRHEWGEDVDTEGDGGLEPCLLG